ncbi:MAG: Maf family protein [bacterium]
MPESAIHPPLILASTSSYRADALRRLKLRFTTVNPEIDEQSKGAEKPAALALRLAHAKAAAGLRQHPGSVVIGSDQVGFCNGRRLHKPGNAQRSIEQLTHCSGKRATFYTAVAVHDHCHELATVVPTELQFGPLTRTVIENYVNAEPAFDCAGGFKIEGLGISLFTSVSSSDPSAIIGLPLIATITLLRSLDWQIPTST